VSSLDAFLDSIFLQIPRKNFTPIAVSKHYQLITQHIESYLEINKDNEAYYCSRLISQISEPCNLFLAASMVIRYVNQFAKPSSTPINVFANRGASGIDGSISSAVGIAIATKKITAVLMGDMAFIHDTNGLMMLNAISVPMLIVVINNNGGGIFHLLPIANEPDVLTPYLDAQHHISLSSLCHAHDVEHFLVYDAINFDEHVRNFFKTPRTVVIEVKTNIKENAKNYLALCDYIRSL
jgi:2-succinyl-5-enolpyruvyl-6-hydroxy-3-cyclohexene-1-carboxylate synthase